MKREVVAPAGGGTLNLPLSPAIKANGFVFCSGQVAVDAATGEPRLGSVEAETETILGNIARLLEAAGSSLGRAVKVTVLLADIGDFERMNAVYRRFFPHEPPARTTFAVAGLAYGFHVEIEVTALAGD